MLIEPIDAALVAAAITRQSLAATLESGSSPTTAQLGQMLANLNDITSALVAVKQGKGAGDA